MLPLINIVSFCWLIFLVYWGSHWRAVKPTKETKVKMAGLWYVAGEITVFALYFMSFLEISLVPLTVSLIPPDGGVKLAGVLLAAGGLAIMIAARRTIAQNWSNDIELKKDHELITGGVYAYIRHPIYTGALTMGLGTFLFSGRVSALMFLLIVFFFVQYKARNEEKLLLKHFPREYPAYMKKVKALIPFVY